MKIILNILGVLFVLVGVCGSCKASMSYPEAL